jgi:anti-sigma factor RsiW
MNHNFDARDKSRLFPPDGQNLEGETFYGDFDAPLDPLCDGSDCLDNLKRDRFEMISAYLDGEGSSEERRQVECWLQNDATVQQLYSRLLALRQGIQTMPTPVSNAAAVERTIEQVFARLDAEQPVRQTQTVPFNQAELLSAYLDGEVTPAERHQVERWLRQDPALQRLYAQMQRLQHAVHTLPVPAAKSASADAVANRVFAQVQRRRTKRVVLWSGAAAAAAIAGVFTTFLAGGNSFMPRFASNALEENNPVVAVSDDALMIALDQPIIEIPVVPGIQPEAEEGYLSLPRSPQDVQ